MGMMICAHVVELQNIVNNFSSGLKIRIHHDHRNLIAERTIRRNTMFGT